MPRQVDYYFSLQSPWAYIDVFGSPVYVLDGEVSWGQDRIELLADALKSGRKPYRSQV